jgi:hypothetical protein
MFSQTAAPAGKFWGFRVFPCECQVPDALGSPGGPGATSGGRAPFSQNLWVHTAPTPTGPWSRTGTQINITDFKPGGCPRVLNLVLNLARPDWAERGGPPDAARGDARPRPHAAGSTAAQSWCSAPYYFPNGTALLVWGRGLLLNFHADVILKKTGSRKDVM